MTDIRKLQINAEFTDTGVATGLKGIADKSEQMGKAVKAAADDGAKALGGMGDGAKGAQAQVERATKGIISSIQRATAVAEAGGRANAQSSEKFFESLSSQRGISADAIRPYLDQLDQARRRQDAGTSSLNNMGQSARATAAALRTVPAQFTDIVVSLQGGQAPFTVLLQQGGQLKDQFGGVGNAARALGNYIGGLINPITVVAAAALGIGVAFVKGAQEAQVLNETLILTGNGLNTTKQDLIAITERLSAGSLTQSGVTAALNEIVASGAIGRENLEKYTKTFAEFERAGGASVGEVVKNFAKLKEAPLQGLLELNKGQNFLTESVYKTVKSLADQGKSADAARVASEAYYQFINQATPQLEQNLGSIDRLWRSIKAGAAGALSGILSVGRELSGSERVLQIQSQLSAGSRSLQGADPNSRAYEIQLKANEALRSELNSMFRKGELQAQINTQRDQEQAKLKGTIAFDAQAEKYLDKKVKMQRELSVLQENARNSGKLETEQGRAEFKRIEAAIVDGYKEKSGSKAKPQELRDFESQMKRLNDIQSAASSSARELSKSEAELEKIISSPSWQKYNNLQQSTLIARSISAQRAEDEKEAQQNLQKAQDAQAKAYRKYIEDLSRGEKSALERIAAVNDESKALELSEANHVSLAYAINQVSIARAKDKLIKNQDDSNAVAAIEREIEALERLGKAISNQEDIQAGQRAEKDRRIAEDKGIKDQQEAYIKSFENIRDGLSDALIQGGGSAKKYLVNLFKKTLLQPIIQPIASSIAGALLGGFSGLANAQGAGGGAGGLLSSLLGGGGGGGSGGGILGSIFGGGGGAGNPFSGIFSGSGIGIGGGIASAITGGLSAGFGGLAGSIGGLFGAAGTGATLGGALSAGSIALGAGNIVGGLATFAGALGPIALGISVVASLLKKKVVDSGIKGEFGGDTGFSGNSFVTKKSFFGGRKDSLGALDEGLRLTLANQFGAIKTAVIDQAKSLSLNVDGVDAVRSAFKLSTKGLNEDQIKQALEVELKNAADSLAKSVLGEVRTFTEQVTSQVSSGYGDNYVSEAVTSEVTLSEYVASALARAGETTSETLSRLSTSLLSVNEVFRLLGATAVEASLSGGDRASKLVDLAGGKDAFNQLGSVFYEKFFNDQEKLVRSRTALSGQLSGLGLDPEIGRRGYRDALQAAASQGNDELAAGLLKLAPAFDAVATVVESLKAQFDQFIGGLEQRAVALQDEILGLRGGNVQAAQSSRELDAALQGRTDAERALISAQFERIDALGKERDALVSAKAVAQEKFDLEGELLQATGQTEQLRRREIDALDESNRALKRRLFDLQDFDAYLFSIRAGLSQQSASASSQFDSAITGLQTSASAASSLAQEAQALFDSLGQSIKRLRGDAVGAAKGLYDQSRQFISQSAQQASSGFGLPNADALSEATSQAISGLGQIVFASTAEADFERLRLAGELEQLQAVAGGQKSIAQSQLDAANLQIAQLQKQSDTLRSIAQTLDGLSREQLVGRAAQLRSGAASDALTNLGGVGVYAGSGGATGIITGNQAILVGSNNTSSYTLAEVRDFVNANSTSIDGIKEIYRRAKELGINSGMLDDIMQFPRGTSLRAALDAGLPAFAAGGYHSGGFALVGERGPEIVDMGPSRVYNNSQSKSMLDTSKMESLIEKMAERIEQLEGHLMQANIIASRTGNLLDNVTQGGGALRTVAA